MEATVRVYGELQRAPDFAKPQSAPQPQASHFQTAGAAAAGQPPVLDTRLLFLLVS